MKSVIKKVNLERSGKRVKIIAVEYVGSKEGIYPAGENRQEIVRV